MWVVKLDCNKALMALLWRAAGFASSKNGEENALPCPKHPKSFVSLWVLVLLLSHPRDEVGFHPRSVPPALQMLWKGLGSPLKPPKFPLPSHTHTWASTGLREQPLVFGD